jgi:hypothetical protein
MKCLYLCYLCSLTSLLVVCAQEQQVAGVVYFETKVDVYFFFIFHEIILQLIRL